MTFAPDRIPSFFKKGDVVNLVSGSPRLTVLSYSVEKTQCCWFDWPTMHCHVRVFPTAALRFADLKDQKAWHSPPVDKAPESIVRSSRTNQLITDYPDEELTDNSEDVSDISVEGLSYSDLPSAGSIFKARANNLANFGQADPTQENPF